MQHSLRVFRAATVVLPAMLGCARSDASQVTERVVSADSAAIAEPVDSTRLEPAREVPIEIEEPTDSDDSTTWQRVAPGGWLASHGTRLQDTWVLPSAVSLRLAHCGESANATWRPEEQAIVLCYELLSLLRRELATAGAALLRQESDVPAGAIASDDTVPSAHDEGVAPVDSLDRLRRTAEDFTFYHEEAHMLRALLALPITGREEDFADQYAILTLLDGADRRPADLVGVVRLFQLAQLLGNAAIDDSHSLPLQRAVNVVCLAFGRDPNRFAFLLDEIPIALERLETCAREYSLISAAIEQLLAPSRRAPLPDVSRHRE